MQIGSPPLFRKVIVPWYDGGLFCLGTGVFSVAVFAFGCVGVSTASALSDKLRYVWVPAALIVLSAAVLSSLTVRMFRRHAHRTKKELP